MKKSRLCVIGAGFHATTNIYPSAIEAGAEIAAIATRSMERSKAALQRFGSTGTAYDDYKVMLQNEDCDGVIVVAQPHDQTSLVLACLEAGKHVYVDKPLGWNALEAAQIADAAEQAGVVLMVGFMKRYAPVYMKLKELITNGTLGAVRSFETRFAVDSTPFCKDDEQFMKLAAIHIVDLMRHLFGEVSQVTGFSNSNNEFISQSISLRFDNGIVGSVYFSGMSAWSRESESMLVTFDHGFAHADEINTLRIHKSLTSDLIPWQSLEEHDTVFTPSASAMSGCFRDLYLRGFVGEMAHFMECSRDRLTPRSSGRDNVGTMDLCDRILSTLV
ncbi:Gfo/Idh/MocA family protein [Paenibacillus alginolyticus]|uniref:Gfo/Idh/MocA family oxidoreductase n=1 Tax=Paenibacillus alginolyticus TaxID=59839 RepID=A0ABT4GAJ7_9BACL|nr:Gfo/Idh/MocA family oxidoreductase [Paenibacillus alginolyticus]MCY9693188.1 Gfo/Idh/MocA family oxidoreductase [Paenibacillus alginolyticus]MEC0144517.1 Gfo/Idh/MocA family oxidoreductase [Paenibacillus alginolyticus]